MGTSKRSLNEKVKKLLKDRSQQDLGDFLPEVRSEVFAEDKVKNSFSTSSFGSLVEEGMKGLSSIKERNFSEVYDYEVDEDNLKDDHISIERVTEKILEIAEENEDIESELLTKAFKHTMATMIKEDKEINEFINEFCYYLIKLLSESEMMEALSAVYHEDRTEKFEKLIEIESRRIVDEELEDDIEKFIKKEIDLEDLIEQISVKCASSEIGGF